MLLAACDPGAADGPPATPALWEVKGPDNQIGWLFGTAHALPKGANWQTPTLNSALGQARLLIVEIADLGDSTQAARELAARAHTPGLPPLSERVAPDQRATLLALMKRAGLDDASIGDRENWAAALMIASGLKSGNDGEGADMTLLATDLPVLGLESYAAQFSIFDELSPQDQTALLLSLSEEASETRSKALTDAWLAGDMEAIEGLTQTGLLTEPGLRKTLLTDRNEAWDDKVIQALKNGRRPFVAVGSGHMIGPDGLPALLEQQGYKVRRIQ